MTSPVDPLASIEPLDRVTVVERVVAALRREILFGRLPAGDRLPAERDLAARFGVNRLTLRAALARLQALGLIVVRHGTGTVVAPWRETSGPDTLAFLLRAGDPADDAWRGWLEDLLEIRRIVAIEALGLACERRTDVDIALIRDAIEAARAEPDPVRFAHRDVDIARAVVRASHNLGLELLLNTLARFPDLQPEVAQAMYPHPDQHMAHHDAVMGLIERGDASLARDFVRAALERQDRETLARLRLTPSP